MHYEISARHVVPTTPEEDASLLSSASSMADELRIMINLTKNQSDLRAEEVKTTFQTLRLRIDHLSNKKKTNSNRSIVLRCLNKMRVPKNYKSGLAKDILSAAYWHGIVAPWTNEVEVDIEFYGSRSESKAIKTLKKAKRVKVGEGDFLDSKFGGGGGGGCAVCLENFSASKGYEAVRMPCSHAYHKHCIFQWLLRADTCPLCRFNFPVLEDGRDSSFNSSRFAQL